MLFGNNLRIESWMYDIIFMIFFLLVLWEGRKLLGREKTSLFLWGSLLWTFTVENLMVINGAYDYYAYANYYTVGGKLITGFSGWSCSVLFVPLSISVGWFLLSFPAFVISDRLLSNRNIWLKAAVAAVMLVSLDMLLDPISVVNEWWRWTVPGFYLRGVSIGNYIGWFFMLFYYAAIYERTVVEHGGFKWLRPLEKLIFRKNTLDMSGMDLWKVRRVLYFRTVVFIPIMLVTTLLFAAIPKEVGFNRFAPFNNLFPKSYDQQFPASARPAGAPSVVLPDNDVRKVKGPRDKVNTSFTVTKEGYYEPKQ
jgi:hypothetical protein